MNTVHLIITILVTITTTLTAIYTFTRDTKEFIKTVLNIRNEATMMIDSNSIVLDDDGNSVRPSGFIVPKVTTYHTRERIIYDD